MLVLGIESSCDETAAAVVDETGLVRSDVVQSQVALHAQYGGVIPELASRDHLRNATFVVREALARAGVGLDAIDAIAVTNRPGLVGALLVGVQLAKGLAWAAEKPIVGVDHLVGHLLAVFLRRERGDEGGPPFPFVCLLASGGHTALYRVDGPSPDRITELGATRDDAAGEAFDKVAKMLGLGYPGGPRIDRLAALGNPESLALSRPMVRGRLGGKAGSKNSADSDEFSFSGIKTQIAQHIEKHGLPSTDGDVANVCASFQATVTSVLSDKLLAAAEREGVKHVVIGGGVAANRELRARVTDGASKLGIRAWLPSLASCTDNAAMIAYAGIQRVLHARALEAEGGAPWVEAMDGLSLVATSTTVLPRRTRKGRGVR